MGCASPPATIVIAELAARGISRHCRRRPPSVVAGPTALSPAPTMSPKRCRGADSPSSLGIPRYRLHRRPTWPGLGSAAPVREHDTRGNGGGFAPLEAFCRRVAPLLVQFPPFGGGEVAVRGGQVAVRGGEVTVRGGVAPTSQTTAATNADNGVSWARKAASWTQRRLAARVARTRTRDSVR